MTNVRTPRPPIERVASRWLRTLGPTPTDLSQHLELAQLIGIDTLAETLLGALEPTAPYPARTPLGYTHITHPTRTHATKLPWHLPRRGTRDRLGQTFARELAASMALASLSSAPAAVAMRRMGSLSIGRGGWLANGLEGFTELQSLDVMGPHPDAPDFLRRLDLPTLERLYIDGWRLGSTHLDGCSWNLPQLRRLVIARCGLTRVPPQVEGLKSLEVLAFADDPIAEAPAWLAELPRLRSLHLATTNVRTLPPALRQREGLTIHMSRPEVPLIPGAIEGVSR